MARRPFRPDWSDAPLERRELLSQADLPPVPALVGGGPDVPRNLFHQNGINGLVLHKNFLEGMNLRLGFSAAQAGRVSQAFQGFQSDYASLPVNPPAGSNSPTLPDLISKLKLEVDYALQTREQLTPRPQPSLSHAPTVSRLANVALIPFANAQLDRLQTTLAATPPVTGPHGTLVQADPTPALNTAINAILNALAETSLHPRLFLHPGDFYLSPDVQFTINWGSTAPASAAPGYFVRGPHGKLLPGATVHPHLVF